jgi:hypothetical protein
VEDLHSSPCCIEDNDGGGSTRALGAAARAARVAAGMAFLALAGALSSRQLVGRVSLWPTATVPAWFGISHLVAAQIGYRGCPELGAIPTVMLGRTVPTRCGPWERLDRRLEALRSDPASATWR